MIFKGWRKMEAKTEPPQISLNWFEIWRSAFLHPRIQTFSQIASDPKASVGWGMVWAGIASLLVWILGPQRYVWWGLVADQFGLKAGTYFLIIGTIASPILGMIALLVIAAMSHALARLFKGSGTFRQLVFCWGVIQLPFILFSGLVYRLYPYLYAVIRSLLPGDASFTALRIIFLMCMLIATAGMLYLFYAQVVAFSAVERFGIGIVFGVFILLAVLLGIARACLSHVIR
jgi:hypothetical protein